MNPECAPWRYGVTCELAVQYIIPRCPNSPESSVITHYELRCSNQRSWRSVIKLFYSSITDFGGCRSSPRLASAVRGISWYVHAFSVQHVLHVKGLKVDHEKMWPDVHDPTTNVGTRRTPTSKLCLVSIPRSVYSGRPYGRISGEFACKSLARRRQSRNQYCFRYRAQDCNRKEWGFMGVRPTIYTQCAISIRLSRLFNVL